MAAYRYLCFPSGAQPSAEDLVRFRSYHGLLDNHVAYGVRRDDGALVIVCETESFDRLRDLDATFNELIRSWCDYGVGITDTLGFVKEAKPWKQILQAESTPALATQPEQEVSNSSLLEQEPQRSRFTAWMFGERLTLKKQQLADESYGHGLLEIHRSAGQARRYERVAASLPYFLWGIAAILVLIFGAYVSNRLLDSSGESRSETIHRINEDAMNEDLKRK